MSEEQSVTGRRRRQRRCAGDATAYDYDESGLAAVVAGIRSVDGDYVRGVGDDRMAVGVIDESEVDESSASFTAEFWQDQQPPHWGKTE